MAEIKYDECIPTTTENCYAMGTINGVMVCMGCKKGYVRNEDYQCEKIVPPNCDPNSNFVLKENYVAHAFYSYYHTQDGLGCNKCLTGYTAVEVSSLSRNPYICTLSEYIRENPNLPETSNYIPNCKNYSIENNLLECMECDLNHLLYTEGSNKICVIRPNNCLELN